MQQAKFCKLIILLIILFLPGCTHIKPDLATEHLSLPEFKGAGPQVIPSTYLIGPGDNLSVFVWGNQDLSATVPVRPDGMITTPLVEDVEASGKTPTQLARIMEKRLSRYVKNPVVTVTVTDFVGRYDDQVRVIGEASKPQALRYRENMTVLDVLIAVGGLTEYAAGNRAIITRNIDGKEEQIQVRLHDLIKKGDISANIQMWPGDILIIPESWF
jgi:polysaccharide biosynthesis/export protein